MAKKRQNKNKLNTELTKLEIKLLQKKKENLNDSEIVTSHIDFLSHYPDGKISKKQCRKLYKKALPDGSPELFGIQTFKAFDKKKTGFIKFDDYLIAANVFKSNDIEDRLDAIFNVIDKDQSGYIGMKELKNIIKVFHKLHAVPKILRTGENSNKHRAKVIMAKFYKNKHDKISIDEFVEGCASDTHIRGVLEHQIYVRVFHD